MQSRYESACSGAATSRVCTVLSWSERLHQARILTAGCAPQQVWHESRKCRAERAHAFRGTRNRLIEVMGLRCCVASHNFVAGWLIEGVSRHAYHGVRGEASQRLCPCPARQLPLQVHRCLTISASPSREPENASQIPLLPQADGKMPGKSCWCLANPPGAWQILWVPGKFRWCLNQPPYCLAGWPTDERSAALRRALQETDCGFHRLRLETVTMTFRSPVTFHVRQRRRSVTTVVRRNATLRGSNPRHSRCKGRKGGRWGSGGELAFCN